MSDVVIRVENLGKMYRIGKAQQRHDSLRDFIADCGLRIANLAQCNPTSEFRNPNSDDRIWALKDVSFEVKQGEVVGIIGRNGAGKSTLLKILSRITEPTEGRARVKGKVRSLLEVGTGFHPELTGRENIYLSGAILGMSKAEIDRRFDEIVDFSGVEKFLDTPVKRYSSGMNVRLGFAVAAHLEPEVLLVDEVLAVGDAEFQKKCLGKMTEVAHEGRTVLFVSHNMLAVQSLCGRVILLEEGELTRSADAASIISYYFSQGDITDAPDVELAEVQRSESSVEPGLKRALLRVGSGQVGNHVRMGGSLKIIFEFQFSRPIKNPGFGFGIDDEYGNRVVSFNSYFLRTPSNAFSQIKAGTATCSIPNLTLLAGRYFLSISVVENERKYIDRIERALVLEVDPWDLFKTGRIPDRSQGVVCLDAEITVEASEKRQPACREADDSEPGIFPVRQSQGGRRDN